MKSKENTEILKRLQKLEILSCRLLGGWLPGIERWEHIHAAALHLWQDAQHSKELRTRLWELRVSNPDRKLRGNLDYLAQALACSQSDSDFLAALYQVIKPAILDAYKQLTTDTYQVYDAPTISALRHLIHEKESQLAWADDALRQTLDSGEKQRQANLWTRYIQSVLEADGGIAGTDDDSEAIEWPTAPPATHISPLPFAEAKRDDRFEIDFKGIAPPEKDDFERQRLYQFVNYAHEMQAAETLGSVLWEAEDMEWEFYYDVARHCYDEARHSELGETRLKELGHHITDFPHCVTNFNWRQLYDPLYRYGILTYVIEMDSFKYKHETYQNYLNEADHESAEAILYDITDETLHVRWGQKWVPKLMEQYQCKMELDDFVTECRSILMNHTTNPKQVEYAELAGNK